MPYVIRRTDQGGGWVADPQRNGGASYTRALQRARTYPTREQAERDRCPGNEVVESVEEAFR
jgi:hypothetical protein